MLSTEAIAHDTQYDVAFAAGAGVAAAMGCFLLQPVIAMGSVDAYAYISGAESIAAGRGYTDLSGAPLNHWPPVYSLLLSIFQNPLSAALVINYVCLGCMVALLCILLRRSGWPPYAAVALPVALGFGAFRIFAGTAMPDVLTYAVFLVGVLLYQHQRPTMRLGAYALWAALIGVKLLAVIFVPAGVLADVMLYGVTKRTGRYGEWAAASLIWLAGVGSILWFNLRTIHQLVPATHPTPHGWFLISVVDEFVRSLPRSFLASWHGNVASSGMVPLFGAVLLLAIVCFASLRPNAKNMRMLILGGCLTLLFLALEGVRAFGASVRLAGYIPLVLLLGFRPRPWSKPVWMAYGAASVLLGLVNAKTGGHLGFNDPHYRAMALSVRPCIPPTGTIASNSFHILDLHIGVPTEPVHQIADASNDAYFLWVELPNYDAGSSPVWPLARPGAGWCEVCSHTGAILFRHCAGQDNSQLLSRDRSRSHEHSPLRAD